jgi:hypothetical protein
MRIHSNKSDGNFPTNSKIKIKQRTKKEASKTQFNIIFAKNSPIKRMANKKEIYL